MSQEFEPGDTVQVKSGGPKMTVVEIIDNKIHCSWFDGNGESNEQAFDKVLLKMYEAPSINFDLTR